MRGLAVVLLLAPRLGLAQEFVTYEGPMDDMAFYRAVACAAPPGGDCQKPMVRWSPTSVKALRVGLAGIDQKFPDYKLATVLPALGSAVAEINGAETAVRLTIVEPGDTVDIGIFLTNAAQGEVFDDQSVPAALAGRTVTAGTMALRTEDTRITHAVVALARDISRQAVASVLLEELTQALGLTTDLRNPAYRRQSVFDEDGNSVTRLAGQDRRALQLHYPPDG